MITLSLVTLNKMFNKIALIIVLSTTTMALRGSYAQAYDCSLAPGQTGYDAIQAGLCSTVEEVNRTSIFDEGGIFNRVVDTLLFLVGAVSVLMIIIGGIRYILSSGDQQQAANAKNTILYSVIGLVVAVLAWAIINYVLGVLYGDPANSSTTGPIAD